MSTATATAPSGVTMSTATATVTPTVADLVLSPLVTVANEAITYAATFDSVVSDHAALVAAMSVLDRRANGNADGEDSPLVAGLRTVLDTLDKDSAISARNKAIALHTAVRNTAAGIGEDVPSTLLKISGGKVAGNGEDITRRVKGYEYAVTSEEGTATFATIVDLAKALDGNVTDYREAQSEAIGEERPGTFTFEVEDGITVTATKTAK